MSNGGVPAAHQTPWNLKNLEGAIALGGQTIKSLELVNGAAAIGVLTFYGNAADSAVGRAIDIHWLRVGLIAFALGVGLAIITAILAYLAQLLAATVIAPSGDDKWRRAALYTGLASAAMFMLGVIAVAIAF